MKQLIQADLLSTTDYERQRESFRARIIELKRRRRIALGPLIMMVFENRDTLLFQIQEMVRVEHIVEPSKIQNELDVYNAILPAPDELSATLLIEITEEAMMKHWLDQFMGLDHGEKVAIVAGGERVFGEFEGGHSHETKISAVHFVRFRPTASMQSAIADLRQPVLLTVDHGEYHVQTAVPGSMREEWLSDLSA
ncbi:MAG: DUF3501 family protein [Nitrospiraceae bacterium]|jgi:hypothetical protein|uniref:DUF3501 family protein n=1 Tax=Nitrospira cf. moscoviensis SBR1015 TaxID=96242 RepID=UPI000A0EA7DC|nr:DUF3501 family protein [Nitrospira cf. moscoviensis SBR1015]MBY0249332.1 DUF3501 family protein [Nitrospiraceae bacterium]OQW29950.1 MAG: hypothetical protein A4E20_04360 [Nitrospira sp. SG-bin2]